MEEVVSMKKDEYLMLISILLGSIQEERIVEQFGEERSMEVAQNMSSQVYEIEDPASVANAILVNAVDFLAPLSEENQE